MYLEIRTLLALACMAVCFCSCAAKTTPLTRSLITKHRLKPSDMTNLQYYLSDPIRLERVATDKHDAAEQEHALGPKTGRTVEEVIFPKGLSGVAVHVSGKLIRVCFEEERELPFMLGVSGRYQLQATENLPYGEHVYRITEGKKSYLLVKETNVDGKRETRRAVGMQLE